MGAVISLEYSAMKDAYKKADKATEKCESYADKIDAKINQKINELKLGGNTNTSQASYFAKEKIRKLNYQKKQYSNYSAKMKDARTFAQETDESVSSYIKNASNIFRESNDMKVGVIAEFFSWATTTMLNSTAFGRWLNQVTKDVGTWIDGVKRKFKNWYELDGGKYIIKTVLAVIGTVAAAVFLVCVAWPALLAVIGSISAIGLAGASGAMIWTLVTAAAAVVTAVMAVADGVVKSISSVAAVMSFEDDPGWAKRYSSYSSLSEYLRKNNFNAPFMDKLSGIAANIIDIITIVASAINIADLVRNGINVIKQLKNGGISRLLNKVRFKSPNGKVTLETIKHGVKNVIRNSKELKKLITSTNVSRMQTYYEQNCKIYKILKPVQEGGEFIGSIVDEGVAGTAKEQIKDIIKENSSSYEYGSEIVDFGKKIWAHIENQRSPYVIEMPES